jgi:hypothetical protein
VGSKAGRRQRYRPGGGKWGGGVIDFEPFPRLRHRWRSSVSRGMWWNTNRRPHRNAGPTRQPHPIVGVRRRTRRTLSAFPRLPHPGRRGWRQPRSAPPSIGTPDASQGVLCCRLVVHQLSAESCSFGWWLMAGAGLF